MELPCYICVVRPICNEGCSDFVEFLAENEKKSYFGHSCNYLANEIRKGRAILIGNTIRRNGSRRSSISLLYTDKEKKKVVKRLCKLKRLYKEEKNGKSM